MAFFIDTITNQSSTCHGLLLFSSKILPSKQTHSTCSNSNYKLVFGCNSRCLSFYSKSKSQWIVWNCCAFWTTSNQSSWCKIIDARYENLQSILFSKKQKKTTRNSNPKLFSNTKGVMQIKNSTQIDAVLVGEKSPFGQSITVRTLEKMTTVTGGEYRQLYFGK